MALFPGSPESIAQLVKNKTPTDEKVHNQKRNIDAVENHSNSKSSNVPAKKKNQIKKSNPIRQLTRKWVHDDDSIEVLPTLEEIRKLHGTFPKDLTFELQTTNCTGLPAHLRRYRCAPCISKAVGFICAFRWIRQWICKRDPPQVIVGAPILPDFTTHPSQLDYQSPKFPTEFNRLPHPQDLMELRGLLAKILLPGIEKELAWLQDPQVKFIGRRIDLVTKCDYCSATLIGAAWLCSQCGAEACTKCFQLLVEQTQAGGDTLEDTPLKDIHVDWLKRLKTCTKWHGFHTPPAYNKISHITHEELDTLRKQMLPLAENYETSPTSTSPIELSDPYSVPADLVRFLHQPEDSCTEPYIKMHVNDLEADPSIFNRLWSAGQMIVVTGMSDRLKKPWTPDYFMCKYSLDACQCIEANSPLQCPVDTTNQEVWKLRDWPPEADFQNKFPDLFYDFEHALPIPDITTRVGIRNVAAHFPANANVPDMLTVDVSFGKDYANILFQMYIAMKNSDQVGSRGSTVFAFFTWMLPVDAINIQTYAKQGDSEGCVSLRFRQISVHTHKKVALWHLYHAKDSQTLREFLYQHQADELELAVEEVKCKLDDPIHTTRIYVNAEMRKTLREKYGVTGWEVKQKPGEAVFIPAYTAHQVCNLANCIKVAGEPDSDFVSPHSIQRCIKLTEEFRVQNHEHRRPWREDLLQINQMLLYAFVSTGRSIEEFEVKKLTPHS
ncbi:uncharacterized protein VP01_2553g2 [Puccinia sorghi]|uniref:JmjC domain-containing protein n=1 Tax=Puccinia sorghi TaxID=27349 RepID=A0A0L6V572_9BASI|nr:uncharacterized protein VP01_2553g2 [Puccinia sorghi]